MDEIYSLVEKFPEKIKDSYETEVLRSNKNFEGIVFVGMGGNYIAGLVLKEILRKEISVEVCQSSEILLDYKTLVILTSYSGNTKEVVDIFDKLKDRGNILVVTSGGELLKKAKKKKVKLIKIPSDIHQRFTFAECFFPILKYLENSGMIKSKKKIVKRIVMTLKKNKKIIEEDAIQLAFRLKNENPLFYASQYFYPAAYRMQTAIEEDVKIICHANKITELFHNELEALPASYFFPVLILDKKEIQPFVKQVKFFKKHIKDFYEIGYGKYSKEERMFLIFYFVDFLGYHLSRLKDTDIGETPLSDKIKKM